MITDVYTEDVNLYQELSNEVIEHLNGGFDGRDGFDGRGGFDRWGNCYWACRRWVRVCPRPSGPSGWRR